jgi:outer membrane protein OmpA-like peptidoglycan-associated protein
MLPMVIDKKPIRRGIPITFTANGYDADGDKLSYSWQISANAIDGTPLQTPALEGDPTGQIRKLTSDSVPGVYVVRVTTSDGIDSSLPAELTFAIEEETNGPSIFFDFDKYKLSDRSKTAAKAREVLLKEAKWLLEDMNRQIVIRVEGNADRRGSVSYNLRLGCRRACEARRFLISQGIDGNRIRIIISYGKSRASDNPTRYAYDRRVDLMYIRGYRNDLSLDGEVCTCQKER